MAKIDPAQQTLHYASVRENTLAMIGKAEEAIRQIKAFGGDFAEVFEKTHKRHSKLLEKISKLIDRDQKKSKPLAKPVKEKRSKAKAAEGKPATVKAAKAKAVSTKPAVANKAEPASEPVNFKRSAAASSPPAKDVT